ncbi:unnamed protein product [Brassica napus]|uniref:non-specific serine/threonine protein kinase n=1 Tax=Brassica napus TaxID=3708 RepID=A0A816VGA2_BRANA|nr:unnamed protein product [Brassica napus]
MWRPKDKTRLFCSTRSNHPFSQPTHSWPLFFTLLSPNLSLNSAAEAAPTRPPDLFQLPSPPFPSETNSLTLLSPTSIPLREGEMCRNIVQGIARGLRYIHEESQLWVVHRDINPTNILLDLEFKPKIAGFALARMMQQGESEGESTVIAGTIGFLDPEYMRTGRVSIKSDVYAFGVTILMIISRRRAYSSGGEESLIEHVMRCWNRGETIYVVHEVMREQLCFKWRMAL